MNLPNKITVFRLFLVPLFAVVFLLDFRGSDTIALVIFVIACVSDFFDGYIARKNNLITDFGKLMDPLADKLLICTALICFVKLRGNFPAWCAILIVSREFVISGIRQVAAEKKKIIMASFWGKFKTVAQMVMCGLFILNLDFTGFYIAEIIIMWLASVLTLLSLVDYIVKNVNIFRTKS